jgi:hypothetical protein
MAKNRARFAIAILLLVLLLNMLGDGSLNFLMPLAKAEPVQDSSIVQMVSQVDESEIYNTAYTLQNFMTRAYAYPENIEAAAYLYNRLSNISGLNVEYQGEYNNIIATLPGVDSIYNDTFIVGAHYDSISSDSTVYAPGATDNGCGAAVVLELARIMSQYSFNHTIKFAFWNNEESGALGSLDYVKYAVSNKINVSLYVNFDVCCYDPDDQMTLDIISNPQSSWVSDMMTEYNILYGIYWTLTYNVLAAAGSDHFSFWDYGYPAVWTSSESWGPIHTENDTIDIMSVAYAAKDGQLCMSVIAALAKDLASPPTPTPNPSPSPTPQPGSQIPAVSAIASTYNGATHAPLNAIDGVESSLNYWGTAAVFGLPQWLKIDLGFSTNINQTVTHFYDGDSRTYTYYIEASSDSSQWTTVVPTKIGSGIVTDTFAQVSARYVRVTVTGNTANTAAHIEEIKVYQGTLSPSPSPTPTVSPTLTPTPIPSPSPTPVPGFQIPAVSASASSFNGESYGPLNAIDGVESSSNYWGTVAVSGLPQWLKVDLGSAASICQVVTHFYDGSTRTYSYYVDVSVDGSSWTTVVSTKTASGIVTDTFAQVSARYVRVTVTGNTANTAAHIEEIKIYQSTVNPTPTPSSSVIYTHMT